MVEIVAEISGNHGGSLNKARHLIIAAADCGCDYAKFQFYRPEDMPDRHEGDNDAIYRKLMVPDEWLPELFDQAYDCCIGLFASVFSVRAVETLLKFDVPYFKIAAPGSTPLDAKVRDAIYEAIPKHIPLIVSNVWDGTFLKSFTNTLAMVCPPGHPPNNSEIWESLRRFDPDWMYGFSDHTAGIAVPLGFIRAGVRMIEKHFKINDDCIDAAFSADPPTMELLCKLAHR